MPAEGYGGRGFEVSTAWAVWRFVFSPQVSAQRTGANLGHERLVRAAERDARRDSRRDGGATLTKHRLAQPQKLCRHGTGAESKIFAPFFV